MNEDNPISGGNREKKVQAGKINPPEPWPPKPTILKPAEETQPGLWGRGSEDDEPVLAASVGRYPNTQWTLVIEAMQSDDESKARRALELFCEQYRDVVCGFFRRRLGPDQADNYTQEFFLRKIHQKWDDREGLLFNVKRKPGSKFRYYLAPALRCFLIDMGRAKRKWMMKSGI